MKKNHNHAIQQTILVIVSLFQKAMLPGNITASFPIGLIPDDLTGLSEREIDNLCSALIVGPTAAQSSPCYHRLYALLAVIKTGKNKLHQWSFPWPDYYETLEKPEDKSFWPTRELFSIDQPEFIKIINRDARLCDIEKVIDARYKKVLASCRTYMELFLADETPSMMALAEENLKTIDHE